MIHMRAGGGGVPRREQAAVHGLIKDVLFETESTSNVPNVFLKLG